VLADQPRRRHRDRVQLPGKVRRLPLNHAPRRHADRLGRRIGARKHRVGPYGGYSPVLAGCADYGWSSTSIYRPAGVPWEGTSHQRRGINGAFYDGSARWFSRSNEYYRPPRPAMAPDKNTGHSNPNDMQKWFRYYAGF